MAAHVAASHLAIRWIKRLRELQCKLANEPEHWSAWRWRIQIKVLIYLIMRYGADPTADFCGSSTVGDKFTSLFPLTNRSRTPLRTQSELKTILLRIAEINRFKTI